MQACYQTRLLGVVGVDGGSEFDMSDVRVGLGLATLSAVFQLREFHPCIPMGRRCHEPCGEVKMLVSGDVNSRYPAAFSAPFMGTKT